jgi:hypothetical protein
VDEADDGARDHDSITAADVAERFYDAIMKVFIAKSSFLASSLGTISAALPD